MAKYIKHNSNYIKTVKHQFLKDGSTIFERDWVTVGSQFNFGPGKIPYYRDGNFLFTTSLITHYQKKHKNGVTVATWTYEDVKDASTVVNQIHLDEHTEDIRSYAYYGSCVELLRTSIENIINTFPGNITTAKEDLGVFKTVEEFACGKEEIEEKYVPLEGYWALSNPFDINVYLKNVHLTQYDNHLRYLTHSFDKYQVSTNGPCDLTNITSYEVIMRKMYENASDTCYETVKSLSATVSLTLGQTTNISLRSGDYFITVNNVKLNNWVNTCYKPSDVPAFSLTKTAKRIKADVDYVNGESVITQEEYDVLTQEEKEQYTMRFKGIVLVLSDNSEQTIYTQKHDSYRILFYRKVVIEHEYKYYQMFSDEEYQQRKSKGWVESTCTMDFWLPNSGFLNRCDDFQGNVLYNRDGNQPLYTVIINGDILIEGYIYNKQIVPLVKYKNFLIQPKEEVIEEYFNGLEGFEKQLLTRKTKPQYTNRFITPIEYNLGFLYYKRTYTWPSNGYCIDILSPRYFDFINKLSKTAELLDELWTDNLWRRMTHEAIKNYDWTYTREFEDGEEQDNVDGGERMHKVINVIGRVFDDVKRTIDTIKRNNRVTYDEDRNVPNALISDKLELRGWDIYSTIPSYDVTEEIDEEVITKTVSASEDTLESVKKWYPALESSKMSFADVDVMFMRRLLLSTKRIFETKGTRQSIDMIMGMFGYGNMNEECYSITEEYFTVKPKKYDDGEEESFGDKIVRLNMSKENELLYDEDATGIPVGSFTVFEKNEETQKQEPITYLIPFYNQNKIYDGNFYFQSKGGWFYNKIEENEENPSPYNWTETLSYLHVASQVKDLLNVHPNSVHNGDIYYVVNLNDYIEFTEEELYSHFFVLEDDYNSEKIDSWTNLDLSGDTYTEENGYTQDTEEGQGTITKYKDYVKKAVYLDSIIPYTIGNNPHVGYGNYDMGNEYFEYMKLPFKYSIDTNNFETLDDKEEAEQITFEIDDIPTLCEENNDKIQIFANGFDETTIEHYCDLKDLKYRRYKLDEIKTLLKNKYFLNCKVIHFKNKIENDQYKKYFLDVIIKYLMQIIPSTAILVLENFVLSGEEEEMPKEKYKVYFLASDGVTQIYEPQYVEEGQTAEKPDDGLWCLCPGGTTVVNIDTKIINGDTYFMKCD